MFLILSLQLPPFLETLLPVKARQVAIQEKVKAKQFEAARWMSCNEEKIEMEIRPTSMCDMVLVKVGIKIGWSLCYGSFMVKATKLNFCSVSAWRKFSTRNERLLSTKMKSENVASNQKNVPKHLAKNRWKCCCLGFFDASDIFFATQNAGTNDLHTRSFRLRLRLGWWKHCWFLIGKWEVSKISRKMSDGIPQKWGRFLENLLLQGLMFRFTLKKCSIQKVYRLFSCTQRQIDCP